MNTFEQNVSTFNAKQASKLRREVLKVDTKATRATYGVESDHFRFTFVENANSTRFARALKLLRGSGARANQIS